MKTVSLQIDAHKTIISTESESLNVTKAEIETVESNYDDAIVECGKLNKGALKDLEQYSEELKELEQIANSSQQSSLIQHQGLLEGDAFTHKHCLAFIEFSKKRSGRNITESDCKEKRQKLQKDFTKAYEDVRALKQGALKRSEGDKICLEEANSEKMAKLTPLTKQREKQMSKMQDAAEAMTGLTPVLENLKQETEKLKKKIEKDLVPECKEADEASKMLTEIRNLILSLEACPGGGNFTLTIPVLIPKAAPKALGALVAPKAAKKA